jgi:hypothetical protein
MNNLKTMIASRAVTFKTFAAIGAAALLMTVLFMPLGAAMAQTPVPIVIDSNALLTQVNTWTNSLDDVVFLGVAISIAIAILTFIGAQILKAFRGAG